MCSISVITINYNNKIGLEKTIASLLCQTFKDFEYIIIDGDSTDGSIDIIKTYERQIHQWVSERDRGIYHAMNKGIEKATGQYIMFLNSGDTLYNEGALSIIASHLSGEQIIYGNLEIQESFTSWTKYYPEELKFSYFINDSLPHSGGVFIRKDAFNGELAKYDESLKIISDWKWFLIAIFKHQYTYKYINAIVGIFDFSGISAKPENRELLINEKLQVIDEHFRAIYSEIINLLKYKNDYNTLIGSRYIRAFLKFKRLVKPS
ncbi:MAG: glycosyltransferase [Flavobacterium sp.]|nr:MAG: glycosyltransferase [Flavobacterium sp.]